jgi:hypothetical protein
MIMLLWVKRVVDPFYCIKAFWTSHGSVHHKKTSNSLYWYFLHCGSCASWTEWVKEATASGAPLHY